jgi:uncharacterized protein (TIGR03437 family)
LQLISTWRWPINVLTPLGDAVGQVPIVATVGTNSGAAFNTAAQAVAPSFLRFGATNYVVATHANGSLLGPASMSVPGYTFTPAQPGETIILYAVGFGLPTTTLTEGSSTQSGTLAALPVVQMGDLGASVQFAGVISPGLCQFNVIVPSAAANGDNLVMASYSGFSTPIGSQLSVQR